MTARQRQDRGKAARRREGSPTGAASGGAHAGRTGLLATIGSGVAVVVVSALYRAGLGDMGTGHWVGVAVVVLMGVAVTAAVLRDPDT